MSKILVVGSSNYDLIVYSKRFVQPKETIRGEEFEMGFGGKGANQACIASKLGSSVAIITKLGSDVFGKNILENFENLRINSKGVFFDSNISSGIAQINVDDSGENCIVIIPGANETLTFEEIDSCLELFKNCELIVAQNEIDINITQYAFEIGKNSGKKILYNPAPISSNAVSKEILKFVDILVVNEIEMITLIEYYKLELYDNLIENGKIIQKKFQFVLVLTLGSKGGILFERGEAYPFESKEVEAIDTTGAGDCFIGSLAHFIVEGNEMKNAVKNASLVAALSVTKKGTQKSYPNRIEAYKYIQGGI